LIHLALQAALAGGDMERALQLAPEAIKSEKGGDSAAYLVLSLDALRQKDYRTALDNLEKTSDSGFNVLLKPMLKAWVDLGLGNVTAAMSDLDSLDKYSGFEALKSYHLALLADVSGNKDLADKEYVTAIKGPSGRAVRLVQSYGAYLVRNGDKAGALKMFNDYLQAYPLSPSIKALKEDLLAGKNIPALVTSPVNGAAEALYSMASVIGQERAVGVAATYSYFALMLKPDFPVAQVMLAETAEDRGKWQEALDLYGRVDPSSAYYKDAKIRSAWSIYKLGRPEDAVEKLNQIAKDYPDDIEALVALADMSREQKLWKEAAHEYSRAIDRLNGDEVRHWSLFYARGIAYEQSKQWPLAEADLLKALKLQPNHPQVMNYLAYSWVDRDENLGKAKEMLIKAVALRPRDGYIVDSLGWLYYRMGDFKDAVAQLEKAVSLEAADPTINDHLGDALWRVGRREEARYQWQRSLWLNPSADQIPLIREKLKNGLKDDIKAEK
ncbi:MAG: tetratricopeptide repeat protein, partial [Alphaproteobacteria bacterium]